MLAIIGSTGCRNETGAGFGNGTVADGTTAAPAASGSTHVVNIQVETITPGPLHDVLVLPGESEAAKDVRIAAQRGGVVEWVGVTEGQRVAVGEQLARIDLTALSAALERTRSDERLADEQLRRRQDLHARQVLAREELDQAKNQQIAARTAVREAEVGYGHGIVSSSLSGVVNKVYVDPGEFVGEGDPVADVVDVGLLRIHFNVPEADVRYLAEGQSAEVRVDAWPERQWIGRIDFVAWKADPATRTFQTRVLVDNADGAIRPGMIARGAFLRRQMADAVSVPLAAIQDKGGERVVYVEEGGVARARTVELGVIDGHRIQVLRGVAPGDRLIVAGQTEVEDGTRVNAR